MITSGMRSGFVCHYFVSEMLSSLCSISCICRLWSSHMVDASIHCVYHRHLS